jgi:hypothetical protein
VEVPDVDMVLLDGDHEYEGVVADIEAWLPKARKLLCGHDYGHPDYPGVARAVDEIFADRVVGLVQVISRPFGRFNPDESKVLAGRTEAYAGEAPHNGLERMRIPIALQR